MAAKKARGIDGRHLLRPVLRSSQSVVGGSAWIGLALFLVASVSIAKEPHPNDSERTKQQPAEEPPAGIARHKTGELTQNVVFHKGENGYNNMRIPGIVLSKQGTLLAFCEGRIGRDRSRTDVVLKRSEDGGRTWGPMQLVLKSQKETDAYANVCPVADIRKAELPAESESFRTIQPGDGNRWFDINAVHGGLAGLVYLRATVNMTRPTSGRLN